MGDGNGGDGGSAVMSGGGGACVGSGRDCCRLPGVIRELWEDLLYNFPFFLEFILNEGGCRNWYVSWVKSHRSMSSISFLLLASKISSVTFLIVEGS